MPASDIEWAISDVVARAASYRTYCDYYDGQHRLLFATEKYLNAFGNLFRAFADNLCPTVVDGISDRLNISGFDGDNATEAEALWKRMRARRATNQITRDSLKVGDSMFLVWKDTKGKVQLWPQKPEQVAIRYSTDEPGTTELAAKVWRTDDQFIRVTLYYPDHLERYITKKRHPNGLPVTAAAFEPFGADNAGSEPVNSTGVVPMFHLANCDDIGEYGYSELRDIIPLQDALNKSVCDMMVAMEFHAFPQRWATGLQIEIDSDTGKPRETPFVPGSDRIWTGGDNVLFGQFPAAEFTGYIQAIKSHREEIARVSGIPLHYLNLSSQYPSGEALKISEGRLVKKVEDRQVNWGDTLSQALQLALSMEGTTVKDDAELQILWTTAAPYNPMLDAETVLIKQQVGISEEQGLRELNYTDSQIAKMQAEIAAAQAKDDARAQAQADKAAEAFQRNGAPGVQSKPAPGQQERTGGLKPGTEPAQVSPQRPRPPSSGGSAGGGVS